MITLVMTPIVRPFHVTHFAGSFIWKEPEARRSLVSLPKTTELVWQSSHSSPTLGLLSSCSFWDPLPQAQVLRTREESALESTAGREGPQFQTDLQMKLCQTNPWADDL